MPLAVPLDPEFNHDLLPFLANQVPGVTRSNIGRDRDSQHRDLKAKVKVPLPRDLWFGVRDGLKLVGAVHASAHIAQARRAAAALKVQPGNQWVDEYVRKCLSIDEIGVLPSHQKQGIGQALLEKVLKAAAQDQDRDLENVDAYASEAAKKLFSKLGFTVGDQGMPVPQAYTHGLALSWNAKEYPGANVYRHWP